MNDTIGGPDAVIDPADLRAFVADHFDALDLDGRSLCLVVPDATRVCPLPQLIDAVLDAVSGRVRSCKAVIALGTHAPMSPENAADLVGGADLEVLNHAWWDADTFATVGELPADRVAEISGGRLSVNVSVRINRLVVDSDVTVIIGPVLPHEVVGFSGGNKYLFPGLSGPELIDVSHWLGALVTSREIIGTRGTTPVRALIDAAAALVPGERHALCVVVDPATGGLHSASFGTPQQSWAAAVGVAAETHITYLSEPVTRVVSIIPDRYDDLWTGAKGFYKVEPVVADGGEVILVAPHITRLAAMHPGIEDLGYHCRDFFLAHWDRYSSHPWGELAHSTHLFGAGTYDEDGEHQRVRVSIASAIPEDVVRRANLHYVELSALDVDAFTADPGTLVIPDAGETLYRLRSSDRGVEY